MTFLLISLLLQAQFALPARSSLENPAVAIPVSKKLEKDYDKLWKRFLTGKEDAKVSVEFEKLLKKDPSLLAATMVEAYIDLYAGRQAEAERRLEVVLSKRPADQKVLSYLSEMAYLRNDYVRASGFYTRLRMAGGSGSDLEMKSQRSLLLGMEKLLQGAMSAAGANNLGEAERLYRQALGLAPKEPALHGQLALVLERAGRKEEADAEMRLQADLAGTPGRSNSRQEDPAADLQSLGRWGDQISRFHELQASGAITREQAAALFARYFPQLVEFRSAPELMTDVQGSWAGPAIETVVGLGILDSMPNHTFQPSRTVTRGEFAQAVGRVIRMLGVSGDDVAPIAAPDLVPGTALYRELQPVVGYGLLPLDNAGNFNVTAPVRGEEAVNTAEKLLALIQKKVG